MRADNDPKALLTDYEQTVREGVDLENKLSANARRAAALREKILALSGKGAEQEKGKRTSEQSEPVSRQISLIDDEPAKKKRKKTAKRIAATVATVRALGGKTTNSEFAEKEGIDPIAARVRLIRATDKGLLVRPKPGHYEIAPERIDS